ncbi:hypothetical protein C0Q70_06962 [Pomacea canaliculata]|uniref:Uncharacterized protein n=1 Tax=Pomacea canaliculata TaxID=400727 RepID=A0A2T7PDR0_POMCA|nr:hypothetical protein C0Q70_06962 [Pomacea canaliculata]
MAVVFMVMTLAGGQVPIPPRHAGFVYRCGHNNAPIHFDLYIDLTCSDSLVAFPTVRKVADHYGPDKLRLTTFLFALPYHRNAYATTKVTGAHAVDIITRGNLTYTWFATVFNNIASLTDSATRNLTDIDVLNRLVSLASAIGVPDVQFRQQIVSNLVSSLARNGWKYACTHPVFTFLEKRNKRADTSSQFEEKNERTKKREKR